MLLEIGFDIGSIVLGLVGLLVGGNGLVRSATRLAASFGVSPLVIGLTVVAIGTSMPELVVSVSAALQGSSDISIGNVVGSNIANIGLILGLAGLITPLVINTMLIKREIPVMIAVSVIALLMALDGTMGLVEGVVLLAGYVIFTFVLYRFSPSAAADPELTVEIQKLSSADKPPRRVVTAFWLLVWLGVLIAGAQFTVSGAVDIARFLGVSELVIGLTLVAVGTSLPEIVTSVIASIRGESDLAAGNVVGSNIANILVILGTTAIIRPIGVSSDVLTYDFPIMLVFSVLLLPFVLDRKLQRWQAAILLLAYVGYIIFSLSRGALLAG
jgi:cation:H+ antiporter